MEIGILDVIISLSKSRQLHNVTTVVSRNDRPACKKIEQLTNNSFTAN